MTVSLASYSEYNPNVFGIEGPPLEDLPMI